MRRPLAALLGLLVSACSAQEAPVSGLRARVSVDRTETRVGDRVGVTIEVETPAGWALETPASPPSEHFFTEALELAEPQRLPGGVRHTLLWTVRPKQTGDHALPLLEVPVGRADGELQRLSVGGVPLPVLSVRDELPEREVYFDIRPPPPRARDLGWLWAGASLLLVLGGATFLALRRQRFEAATAGPSAAELAAKALAELDATRIESDPRAFAGSVESDPRAFAGSVQATLLRFAAARWQLETDALLPRELPDPVDIQLVELLASLEVSRYEKAPAQEPVAEVASAARAWLHDVVGA